ncbi:MAG TPA: HNH endonuclease [Nostocaceae cyanobacterium]|nr:HNH endonuclease [Nostocaceae cyanobacterium]
MKARDFLQPGENIIVIFTDGTRFELGNDNTGITGDWTIDPSRLINRVIIYLRDSQENTNKLYIANHNGVEFVQERERYKIKLAHVQYVGKTDLNWYEFAEGSQNPIRYIS